MMYVALFLIMIAAVSGFTISRSTSRLSTSLNLFGNPEPPKNNSPANAKKDGGMFGGETYTSSLIVYHFFYCMEINYLFKLFIRRYG